MTLPKPPAPKPPAHVEPYVHVLGTDGAVEFLLTFGGGELYLPREPRPDSPVVALLGKTRARALGQAAARLPKRVPTAKPWLAAVLRSRGLSVTEIARKLHASDVAVRGWLRKGGGAGRHDPRQLPLI